MSVPTEIKKTVFQYEHQQTPQADGSSVKLYWYRPPDSFLCLMIAFYYVLYLLNVAGQVHH